MTKVGVPQKGASVPTADNDQSAYGGGVKSPKNPQS